ncbi:MAG: hypothetical protein F6K04_21615 [Leptolyngbya sp. SIO4C5]|nr:hypothetical protein [Leptolyngbya sp. SIO4C5]
MSLIRSGQLTEVLDFAVQEIQNEVDEVSDSLTESYLLREAQSESLENSNFVDPSSTTVPQQFESSSQILEAIETKGTSIPQYTYSTPSAGASSSLLKFSNSESDLARYIQTELRLEQSIRPLSSAKVAQRMAAEVERICEKSRRIQASGEIANWQHSLAQHRIRKCLHFYRLGSHQGRIELHSRLSAIAYRYIIPSRTQLGIQEHYSLLEDFMQSFYVESLKVFRRENDCAADYQPRTRIELAEYMAFTEQYAKRRIALPGCHNQQLIILRAQTFAERQPDETFIDMEQAMEPAKDEAGEEALGSPAVQQLRQHMVTEAVDPSEQVIRNRVIQELVEYLKQQKQTDCIDYLMLRLQDMTASEIDKVLGLTPRERDYLQLRFKHHVESFAQFHQWELVHQWLGTDLERHLGLSPEQWKTLRTQLSAQQQQLLALKQQQAKEPTNEQLSDQVIAQQLGYTTKQLRRHWGQLISAAWKLRNQA